MPVAIHYKKNVILIEKGVQIPAPDSVEIGQSVDVTRIAADGVIIHAGCKILGDQTLVCHGAELGYEAPVTMKNCYVGPNVKLKGGYFENAVFLEGAEAGSGAHVRQGTIFEEQASIAHTVGLKQTILFPYVTLGSLINFCDCLMAGGTGRDNHSEVGSSYIHFNFTPNQDKATPSLIGDVPRGVMLSHSPIFLGGQGGLVGPSRLAFGTVIAAGTICRKDQLKENHLVLGDKARSGSVPYTTGTYYNLKRIIRNNFIYIGNLYALRQWYGKVRSRFVGPDFPAQLLEGLEVTVMAGITERLKQLERLSDKLAESKTREGIQNDFPKAWNEIRSRFEQLLAFDGIDAVADGFLAHIDRRIATLGKDYLRVIKSLDVHPVKSGVEWLDSIVGQVVEDASAGVPSLI